MWGSKAGAGGLATRRSHRPGPRERRRAAGSRRGFLVPCGQFDLRLCLLGAERSPRCTFKKRLWAPTLAGGLGRPWSGSPWATCAQHAARAPGTPAAGGEEVAFRGCPAVPPACALGKGPACALASAPGISGQCPFPSCLEERRALGTWRGCCARAVSCPPPGAGGWLGQMARGHGAGVALWGGEPQTRCPEIPVGSPSAARGPHSPLFSSWAPPP